MYKRKGIKHMIHVKQFFKSYSNLFFKSYLPSILSLCCALGMQSGCLLAGANPAMYNPQQTQPASQLSVHEMFKDVPQDELLQMMEEGQQFIKYLEEKGTPEEKMAFAQAMEETLAGFSEEDWKEFEQIVETVQDQLPPLVIEPQEEVQAQPVQEQAPQKEIPKIVADDNSLDKIFHNIHKAINAILLKAKSDKILTERITITWDKKDDFNEMNRLLQVINTKEHIARLTTAKDETIKLLFESIQNFNKRLQVENDQFVIADTFGLEVDEKTTAANLKKLNKILEFFDSAIASLLPKLTHFVQEYEPEALKLAQDRDKEAKTALEHATKIEKQKRPLGTTPYRDNAPLHGSNNKNNNYNNNNYNHGAQAGSFVPRQHTPEYLEQIHRENLKNVPHQKKSDAKDGQGVESDAKKEVKKEVKKSAYEKAIDDLEIYLEANGHNQAITYKTNINNAQNIYKAFGNPMNQDAQNRYESIAAKRSASQPLNQDDANFAQAYEQTLQAAHENFVKNTQVAHSYYASLQDSIETITHQIDDMLQVMSSITASLDQMNSKELEKLAGSAALKNFGHRIHDYHSSLKNVQHELKNKHKLHQLQRQNPYEMSEYNELANKIENMHGINTKTSQAKAKLETLHKAIKASIARRKRDENKAASSK